jgi:hypothetical protein
MRQRCVGCDHQIGDAHDVGLWTLCERRIGMDPNAIDGGKRLAIATDDQWPERRLSTGFLQE